MRVISFVAFNFAAIFLLLLIYIPLFLVRLFRRLLYNPPKLQPSATPHPPQSQVTLTIQDPQHQGPVRDTAVLIHGYPDSPMLWDATVEKLTSLGYRCLLIGLLGCNGEPVESIVPFDALVDQMYNLIADAIGTAPPRNGQDGDKRVTIIGHDFGAVFSIYLREKYPYLIRKLVLLDVGEMPFILHLGKPSPAFALCCSSYQVLYALRYFVGGAIGSFAVQRIQALHWRPSRPSSELRSDMAFLYGSTLLHYANLGKQVIRNLIQKNSGERSTTNSGQGGEQHTAATTATVREQAIIPTLFIYGRRKLVMYYEDEFLDRVRATPGGAVEEWDCGHWVQLEKEAEWLVTLRTWLNRTNESVQVTS